MPRTKTEGARGADGTRGRGEAQGGEDRRGFETDVVRD